MSTVKFRSFLAIFAGLFISAAGAQELSPAFVPPQTASLIIQLDVLDVQSIEAQALAVVFRDSGLTADEALQIFRVGEQTDVSRCLEYIYLGLLRTVPDVRLIEITISNPHPVAQEIPPHVE